MFWTRAKDDNADADDRAVVDAMGRSKNSDIAVEVLAHHPWTPAWRWWRRATAPAASSSPATMVHLFTLTGGFGMNTGIDDAANLAWKLAAMVQGWGGRGLIGQL